jgi:hypothetical protein
MSGKPKMAWKPSTIPIPLKGTSLTAIPLPIGKWLQIVEIRLFARRLTSY